MKARSPIGCSLLLAALTLPTAFCWLSVDDRSLVRAATPLPATAPTTHVTFKPAFEAMTYYDQRCAHCHGPQGSNYGAVLGNDLDDDALIRKCKAMEVGPGGGAIGDDENLAETAYHRALIMQVPFVSITQKQGNHLEGEVSPGSTVSVTVDGKSLAATVTDWNWTIDLPSATDQAMTIRASANGKTASFDTAAASCSSTDPLPPKEQRRHG